jgi:hypothetical protein
MRIYTLALWLILLTAALFIGGCDTEGPSEQAGKQIDKTMEKAGEKMEDAADKVEEKTDN